MSPPNLQSARPRTSETRRPVDRNAPAAKDFLHRPKSVGLSTGGRRTWAAERRLAQRILRTTGCPSLCFVLWDGQEISHSAEVPVARVVFHDRATFWKVLLDPDLQFGDSYSDGRLEVEGDLVAFLEAVYRARAAGAPLACCLRSCCAGLRRALPTLTPERERTSIATMTSATISIACGSTPRWSTAAPISPTRP